MTRPKPVSRGWMRKHFRPVEFSWTPGSGIHPIAGAVEQLGTWVVPCCPFCRGEHAHDGGGLGDNPDDFLTVVATPCRHAYRLTKRHGPVWIHRWGPPPAAEDIFRATSRDDVAQGRCARGAVRWNGFPIVAAVGPVVGVATPQGVERFRLAVALRGAPMHLTLLLPPDAVPDGWVSEHRPDPIVHLDGRTGSVVATRRPDFESGAWDRGS